MKRRRILPALILLLSLSLAACSANSQSAGGASPAEGKESGEITSQDSSVYMGRHENAGSSGGSRVYTDASSKLIRRASVAIQTVDFPAATAALDSLTFSLDGYYEDAETQGGNYYDTNARRYAVYTVRVPADRYDAFLSAAGDIGHVVSSSESSKDVGDEYYDTELRLKTLQTKQERLLSLLNKADKMEDIIALEDSLSDVQYQIERHTSTLKRYDGLVDYATISITLQEVMKLSNEPGKAESLGKRLAAAFANGFSDFGTGVGNAAVWIAYNFVGTVILLGIAAAVVVLIRRRRDGRDKPSQP